MKINKHIEIVGSTHNALSSMSQRSRNAIAVALRQKYTKVGITIFNNLSDLETLARTKPDLVFLGMKFIPTNPDLGFQDPNKIWISDYLDELGIAYTGSNQLAHELELNKHMAKQRVLNVGLGTSPFYVARQNEPQTQQAMKLAFPLFIKPTDRGGGVGIDNNSLVHDFETLCSKIQSIATNHQSDSLVEQYLPGREFSVAILKTPHSTEYWVMPIELVAEVNNQGVRLLCGDTKSSNTEQVLEVTDEIIHDAVSTLALDVFHALGARDYGRIDIRLDKDGVPHFLEANLIPSLIMGYGSFPKACVLNLGLGYKQMILNIVGLALERLEYENEEISEFSTTYPALTPVFEAV